MIKPGSTEYGSSAARANDLQSAQRQRSAASTVQIALA